MTVNKGKGIANNVQVDKNGEEDVFGVVNEGDKNEQGSHDLNSVRTSLQALAMKSTYTPDQYRKIMKLLNKEKQAEVNMAGISNDFDSLLECDRRRSYDDAMNASNEHNIFSKKGHWIVDSGATCHMTSKFENLDKISRNNKNTERKVYLPNEEKTVTANVDDRRSMNKANSQFMIWHYRMGHPSYKVLKQLYQSVPAGLKDENVRVFIEQPFCDYDIAEVHTPLDVETSDEHAEQTLVPTEHVSENITEEHGDDNMVDVPSPVPRVSSRMSHPPVWMKDYVTHLTNSIHPHSLANYMSYSHLSGSYQTYLSTMSAEDLRELRYFLGIEFCRSEQGIVMNQRKYALELISETGLSGARPSLTPLETNMKLTSADYMQDVHDELFTDINKYQRLIGKLLYLTNIRPDIAFSVQCLSQFMQKPTLSHWNATLKVVKYVKTAPGLGILMSSDKQAQLTNFCDADWAACPNTRRSVTGYLLKYGKSLIAWKSKKQNTVSRSSAEAEYRSLATLTAEVVWVNNLFKELGMNVKHSALHPSYCFENQQSSTSLLVSGYSCWLLN
uniref:GAG-pre-integrase domain-containing protein n=1 Tax=Solanum lycopersicum TaxID=4081 RepID=A0A3Q7FNF9_SOLLC